DVGLAVVVVIAKVHTHARHWPSARRNGYAGHQSHFLEGAVAAIVKQIIGNGVVRNEHVHESVAVVIGERDAHAFAHVLPDTRTRADVLERAAVTVPVERVRESLIVFRMTVDTQVLPPVSAEL